MVRIESLGRPFFVQILSWREVRLQPGVLEQYNPIDHTLENCEMSTYLLQHRADEVLKIPLRTRMSAPNFCPRASASATAAISMASARLLHSFATCNCDLKRFQREDNQVKALYIAKKYHVE